MDRLNMRRTLLGAMGTYLVPGDASAKRFAHRAARLANRILKGAVRVFT